MCKILIIYATVDGQTKRICDYIQRILQAKDNHVLEYAITDLPKELSLRHFDKILIASSIRYGKHNKNIMRLIEENEDLLNELDASFLSISLVARKACRQMPQNNPYVHKMLEKTTWIPKHIGIFAGRLDYSLYGFWDRILIQMIMHYTHGPTDRHTQIEYTDWTAVDKFAELLAAENSPETFLVTTGNWTNRE